MTENRSYDLALGRSSDSVMDRETTPDERYMAMERERIFFYSEPLQREKHG
jgi:hypothetical protein